MKVNELFFKQKIYWWSFVFLFLLVLDQVSKHFAGRIFKNYNFVFSLPLPLWLIYGIYVLVIGCIIYYLSNRTETFSFATSLAWTLILSGAICNVVERIILGYVRDFIYISLFGLTGIYNLSDAYIILGVIILLLFSNI